MDSIDISWLFTALFFLILCSAFFSSSETSMMALNRYRLKHLKQTGHRGARRASDMLERPDRLIGLILIGNNLVNIAAASLSTAIAVRLFGDAGYLIATICLTIVILIFAEVTPKTYAALHPERIAFPASFILQPLQTLFRPLVFITNKITNGIIKWLGGDAENTGEDQLSFDELRILVKETGGQIPHKRRSMLMNILELENVEVDDIMIPRNEIFGIDVNEDKQNILEKIRNSEFTRLPVYRDNIDDMIGTLHMRQSSRFLLDGSLDMRAMIESVDEAYYIPEGTPLHTQLFNFQRSKQRVAIVVDEYGVVAGLVTLEDILEEIVGDFTTNITERADSDILSHDKGAYTIKASATIHDINRSLNWALPMQEAKTINGLLLEQLESFPDANVGVSIEQYAFEIIEIKDNRIVTVKVSKQDKPSDSVQAALSE